jgi:hypothetical protein
MPGRTFATVGDFTLHCARRQRRLDNLFEGVDKLKNTDDGKVGHKGEAGSHHDIQNKSEFGVLSQTEA